MPDKWFRVVGKVIQVDGQDELMFVKDDIGAIYKRPYCLDYRVVQGKDPEMVGVGDTVEFNTCVREQLEGNA